ncbi:hypothetical protein MHT86_03715 [Corynebacterium mastitidis]|uniref:Uncharacterized protein n=1 Tax=Corynebacterium mastitidis TaxID=161890 RepID=A0A2N0X837_9CORY|nr:hypothetical protein [Corynebacterium mastitidis]MCH6196605.1 hypothetical protein [Corynebacterium mastitidis]PKF68839.1 hypothetical protein CXB45_04990 [Corynebacterium mastitidis]
MGDVSIAPEAVGALLRRGLAELEERLLEHEKTPPALSLDVAGGVLYAQGRRLADSYVRLHAAEIQRMRGLSRMLHSALEDIARVEATDRANAAEWGTRL